MDKLMSISHEWRTSICPSGFMLCWRIIANRPSVAAEVETTGAGAGRTNANRVVDKALVTDNVDM